ncbi:3-isopropylmalate dehydrogenase [Christensenellaceae bacterium OttesenSCG-928-K19]|nr:3-isopropylmalate dehydrogenase [Christensenellaceae bacterium OttesenSCG-928-K19]
MEFKIAVIKGDGIGPEIAEQGIAALNRIAEVYGHRFHYEYVPAGGAAIDEYGDPLPDFALEKCKQSDAVLLAAVGGEKWDDLPVTQRPERGLLRLRGELELFANLRPAIIYNELKDACPLKDEIVGDHLDIMVIRELTGDVYFGEKGGDDTRMYDVMNYSDYEVERIARVAFDLARGRSGRVMSVDKANVLATSKLWRNVVTKTAQEYPDIELSHMYVDNAAMQLVRNPRQFDVILTGNIFGDILSDEASMITGSIGMLPSASLGASKLGMYEPIHGSAPDIAGKGLANPIAMILSCAMMLRYSFDLEREADAIENAVKAVIASGARTADIAGGGSFISTDEMGKKIIDAIK